MVKANQDIRDYMADHGVTQRDLAVEVGVSQFSINKKLQTEMSQQDKEIYLNMIDAIVAERSDGVQDEIHVEEPVHTEIEDVSNCTKFQIGDRVEIPSKSNKIGIVSDIWHSIAKDKLMYAVDGENDDSFGLYREDQLELAPLPIDFSFDAHIDGNVAVVTMTAKQGNRTWVYARGHAHILHDGEVGMAQAVSYAARRMFESLDRKQENQIYFKQRGDEA